MRPWAGAWFRKDMAAERQVNVRSGSDSEVTARHVEVRLAPESGHGSRL